MTAHAPCGPVDSCPSLPSCEAMSFAGSPADGCRCTQREGNGKHFLGDQPRKGELWRAHVLIMFPSSSRGSVKSPAEWHGPPPVCYQYLEEFRCSLRMSDIRLGHQTRPNVSIAKPLAKESTLTLSSRPQLYLAQAQSSSQIPTRPSFSHVQSKKLCRSSHVPPPPSWHSPCPSFASKIASTCPRSSSVQPQLRWVPRWGGCDVLKLQLKLFLQGLSSMPKLNMTPASLDS